MSEDERRKLLLRAVALMAAGEILARRWLDAEREAAA